MKLIHPRLLACLLAVLAVLAVLPLHAQQGRTLTGTAAPLVEVHIVPPQGTRSWTVEEAFTNGAIPIDINEAGVFDPENDKAKWGPFPDDAPRTLSYRLTGPAGEVAITGTASFDGSSESIDTMEVAVLGDPEITFHGWRYLTLAADLLHTLAAHPLSDMDLDGFNLLQEYAFGLFLPETADGPVFLLVPAFSVDPPDGEFSYFRNGLAIDLEYEVQRLGLDGTWDPLDLSGLAASIQEFSLGDSGQVSELLYAGIPLAAIEGSLLRVQARLVDP